ncbi:MAG: polysaccharide biosynthesis tyrosine autokinase [Phycisphaerae bacterium]
MASELTMAVGLGAVLAFVHPQYQVRATIHVAPVVRPILFQDYDTDISRQYRQFLATISLNMVGPEVMAETLASPEVRALPIVRAAHDAYSELVNAIEVKQIEGTELLSVSMTGDGPQDMAILVNTLLENYLRRREEQRREWDDKIVGSLQREATELQTKLKSRQEQMRQAATQYGLTLGGDEPGSVLTTLLAELQQLLTQAKTDHARAAAELAAMQAEGGVEGAISTDPAAFEAYLAQDPLLQTLRSERRSLELASLTDRRAGRGRDHPEVRSRPALINDLQNRIKERTQELREVYAASIVRQRQFQLLDAKTTAEFLDAEAAKVQQRLINERAAVGGQKFVLEDLAHERAQLEADLTRVRQKVWNIELERNRTARISIASRAHAPEKPNIDKRPKYSAAAIMLSLLMGAGVAVLRHNSDTRFRDPLDVTARLGVRVLGSIQHIPERAALENCNDARIVEPIRGISTTLLASADVKSCNTRLITSPTAQNGKSSMALNLARSLASTGRRVLLVDADNSGRGTTVRLGWGKRSGLRELLEGHCLPDDVICAADPGTLHILPAGQFSSEFGALLAARQSQDTLRSLFAGYDEVVLDSGPVLASSNTIMLATLVDEIILVLRAGHSRTGEARAAQQQLAGVGGRVVGVILNGVDERKASYSYGYSYARTPASNNGNA